MTREFSRARSYTNSPDGGRQLQDARAKRRATGSAHAFLRSAFPRKRKAAIPHRGGQGRESLQFGHISNVGYHGIVAFTH